MASIVRTISNGAIMLALQFGIPVPPYSRDSGLIVETVGRRSGRPRRNPVGYLEQDGRIIVVAEHGANADWVRNALAAGGRLRVFHRGVWKPATLRVLDADPELYLERMDRRHAAAVRRFGSMPAAVEITLTAPAGEARG